MTNIRKAYQSTKQGQVHYAEAGEGFPLLLLSETPRSHRFFRRFQPLLAPHARTFAVDTPGFGNSHALPDPATIPAVAGCLIDFIDALGFDQVDVFGMHTGDKLAAALAAGWPKRVRRLVLAGQTHSLIPEREIRDAALQPFFAHYHAPKYAPTHDGAHFLRDWVGAHATVETTWWPAKLLTEETITADDVTAVEGQVTDYLLGWRSAVPIYKAVFGFDFTEAATRIEAPTLVLELMTPEEKHFGPQAERLARLMKNATAASVEVTYGSAIETEAAEMVQAILPFLQS